MQKEIYDKNGIIRCPAFAVPLIAYDSGCDDSDNEDYGWMEEFPTYVKAKKMWKKLAKVILKDNKDIPLKQMAIKAKHEHVLFKQMYVTFNFVHLISLLSYQNHNFAILPLID